MRALSSLGVFLLAAASQGAEMDVRAICDAVAPDAAGRREALAGVYSLTFPSSAFRLLPYDRGRGRVAVDGAWGFRGDGWELVLHDLAGGRPPAGALDLAFPSTPGEGGALAAAHQAGQLSLVVWFQPAAAEPPCAVVHSVASDGVRMAIEPLAFELRKGNERIASGESARYAAMREEVAPGPVVAPRVVVQPPLRTAAGGKAPAPMAKAASALAPKLLTCYRLGLAHEPGLRGSLVAGVDIGSDGRVSAARAEIDGLGAAEVTACVLAEMRAARFPRGPERLSIPIRFGSGE